MSSGVFMRHCSLSRLNQPAGALGSGRGSASTSGRTSALDWEGSLSRRDQPPPRMTRAVVQDQPLITMAVEGEFTDADVFIHVEPQS